MRQWKVIQVESHMLERSLNDLTMEGWEIFTVLQGRIFMDVIAKKSLPEEKPVETPAPAPEAPAKKKAGRPKKNG